MQDGATPLCSASVNGYVAIVKLLIEKKADVNICTKVRQLESTANTQVQALLEQYSLYAATWPQSTVSGQREGPH